MSAFLGDWQGSGDGIGRSRVYFRIEGSSDRLSLIGIALRSEGFAELYRLSGREARTNQATVKWSLAQSMHQTCFRHFV